VPTDVFKTVDLCTFDPKEAALTFLTSGTTGGRRGRHHLRRPVSYLASIAPWFDAFMLPDGLHLRTLVLAPSQAADPTSSLSYMLQWAVAQRGATGSRFFWEESGPDLEGVVEVLRRVGRSGEPVLILATARALESLFESVLEGGRRIILPPGSRVMETGGFKGAEQTMDGEALREELARGFEIPTESIVSEYGMTELGSQGYHPVLRFACDRSVYRRIGAFDRGFVFPPWCRVRAMDPDTLEVLPEGAEGLLAFWDLSNVDSILAVQTSDVGAVRDGCVQLRGRAEGATPRGCSLAVDEILSAAKP
jgi:acyl-CoA synthetase (AMP-forming)/AMP-acid ligase II